jgi:hypothetical protein
MPHEALARNAPRPHAGPPKRNQVRLFVPACAASLSRSMAPMPPTRVLLERSQLIPLRQEDRRDADPEHDQRPGDTCCRIADEQSDAHEQRG